MPKPTPSPSPDTHQDHETVNLVRTWLGLSRQHQLATKASEAAQTRLAELAEQRSAVGATIAARGPLRVTVMGSTVTVGHGDQQPTATPLPPTEP